MRLPRQRRTFPYGFLPLTLWVCLTVALALMVCACKSTNPVSAATTPETKAYALYGEFVIAEEQAAALKQSGTLPATAIAALQRADNIAKPTADALLKAVQDFLAAQHNLRSGGPDAAAQLQIATNNLQRWTDEAVTDISALASAVKGAHP